MPCAGRAALFMIAGCRTRPHRQFPSRQLSMNGSRNGRCRQTGAARGTVPYRPLAETFHLATLRLIEDFARATPDKPAVDDGAVRLSYRELLDRVYGLAARLQGGTRPGGVVASVVHNTAAAPIIVMATFISGRMIVPIDAGDPLERQAALFAELGAEAVVMQAGATIDDGFIPRGLPRIVIDPARATGAAPVDIDPKLNGPVYVSFTSGSTGRPKGVAYGLVASAQTLRNFVGSLHLNADDVILGIASLSTGGSRDACAALCTGATIRIVDLKVGGIGEALRVMERERVTILSFVPSVLRSIMQMDGVEASFRNLRILDLYGDRVLAEDIALFRSKLPRACHIRVTLATMEADAVFSWYVDDARIEGPLVPIGYLAPDKRVALVDAAGMPVPPGEAGELLVRGPMAIGNWQGGRLTPGRFIEDPDNPSHHIYATGDLVRLRADGLAEYVGRRDQKVKISRPLGRPRRGRSRAALGAWHRRRRCHCKTACRTAGEYRGLRYRRSRWPAPDRPRAAACRRRRDGRAHGAGGGAFPRRHSAAGEPQA